MGSLYEWQLTLSLPATPAGFPGELMLRLLKMLVLPLVAGSMVAGGGCCLLMQELVNA